MFSNITKFWMAQACHHSPLLESQSYIYQAVIPIPQLYVMKCHAETCLLRSSVILLSLASCQHL